MIRLFAALALVAVPAALSAAGQDAPPALSLEQRMLVRCSAAFAITAHGQETGDAAVQSYPDLRQRGREFFVRASARVMEEAGLDRAAVAAALSAEARDIRTRGTLAQVMPACLPLLPAQ
ncbi:hypothetical protein GRI62_12055 [Erythrobacter arachoides]|uniref:Uncharacterized protein n=1 Tax=Aurantiacibacter arachoides TaxID=1850444 RepID=A0A845A9S8_9SPHN|nr:hypothetical protein [Aurantiacibacter arachoides]MXO94329.1 hypothetical protein [Aurantiacibacter arachoides]GGD64330.1 hypothetical protein GCM10011411_25790 [Aurantiacibacter arachoides]